MSRKGIHLALLLFVLLPALTGWAGDRCCPPDESRCAAPCGESDPGADRDHDNADPGHQQALCSCACHTLFSAARQAPLDVPTLLGRFEPQAPRIHSNAHLSDIFRPPLA